MGINGMGKQNLHAGHSSFVSFIPLPPLHRDPLPFSKTGGPEILLSQEGCASNLEGAT